MHKPRIKICGITRAQDADLALELGAWGVGFVFVAGSPRACNPAVAAGITRRMQRKIELIGVFNNATMDRVAEVADTLGLSYLQFSGNEGPAYCLEAARRTGCKTIKRLAVESHEQLQDRERFHTDLHLLDSPIDGEVWDWNLLKGERTRTPFILSGGLTLENVEERVQRILPWGINVAPEIESSPGVKDHEKMRRLFELVSPAPPVDEEFVLPSQRSRVVETASEESALPELAPEDPEGPAEQTAPKTQTETEASP